MAKNVKITKDTTIKAGKGIFDTVYELVPNKDGYLPTLTFEDTSTGSMSTYPMAYGGRYGDDLVLTVVSGKDEMSTSIGFVTIKNYFEIYSEYGDKVFYNDGESEESTSVEYYVEDQTLSEFIDKPVYHTENEDYNQIVGGTSSTSYVMNNSGNDIREAAGNETYNAINAEAYITDFAGSDTYNASQSEMSVQDWAGTDTYRIKNSEAYISDMQGNDKYDLSMSNVRIYDGMPMVRASYSFDSKSGNDTYNGVGIGIPYSTAPVSSTEGSYIIDGAGNDNYNLSQSYLTGIQEYSGNDNYKLNNVVMEHGIEDRSGNDKYDITSNYSISYSPYSVTALPIKTEPTKYSMPGTRIMDYAGVDTYNINGGSVRIQDGEGYWDEEKEQWVAPKESGSDTYNITATMTANIEDQYGNEKYNVTDAANLYIEDYEGNDTYTMNNVIAIDDYSEIEDYAGNDKYALSGAYSFDIYDDEGTDTYSIQNSDMVYVGDYSGNDKYTVSDFATNVSIWDYNSSDGKNKDVYSITDSFNVSVYDGGIEKSDDTYTITRVDNSIYSYDPELIAIKSYSGPEFTDVNGNDKYTVADSQSIIINDNGEGRDTYTISGSKYVTVNESPEEASEGPMLLSKIALKAAGGSTAGNTYKVSDSYYVNINEADATNTSYSFTTTDEAYVNDEGGADTYVSAKGSDVSVYDYGLDNDKYTVTDGEYLYVSDDGGADTYSVTNTEYASIDDGSGKDKYTFKNTDWAYVYDYGNTSDEYTVDSLKTRTKIYDEGGEADKLTISGLKANNIQYMLNFTSTGAVDDVDDGSLFLLDKSLNETNAGMLRIDDFFATSGSKIAMSGGKAKTDDGYIETINAGKNINGAITAWATSTNISALGNEVASWLNNNGYNTVSEVFYDGSSEDIASLIAYVS